jgi:hypothetical protein
MQTLAEQAKLDRKNSQRSLYYLCKEVLGYRDMVPHVHGDVCHFQTHPSFGRFRQTTIPRSWFKTWVCTVGKAIWLTLPDEEGNFKDIYPYKGPDVRILIASNVIDNAAKMVNKIKREWESNTRLRAAFPELIPEFNKTRWSDHCAEVKRPNTFTEGTYTAVGVGGSVISQHFDHILEDDLVYAKKDDFSGQELMPSQEDIDNAIGWHKLTFSLLANPKTGCIDNTGTRWAPHDVIDHIRKNEQHYSCFEVNVTEGAVWPIEDDSACIWPERYDKATLEQIRSAQGNKIFETQYLNRPRAGEDVTFEMGYVHKHDSLAEYPDELRWFTFVDLASWKDNKKICRNVIATVAKDANNHFWVGRIDAGKFNPSEVIALQIAHHLQFGSKVLVEEVGYQVALRFQARQEMEKEGATIYSIEAIPPDNRKGAKLLRIQSLQPVVKNGMFHCLSSMTMMLEEMEDYPYGAYVDILDTLGHGQRYATAKGFVKPEEPKDPFALESILGELKERSQRQSGYPFSLQLDQQHQENHAYQT